MQVFISYSTKDATVAEAVFKEVAAAGADVFKWGTSEIIGKPSWNQILEWISRADVFVLLLSRNALASNPVEDEIAQAAHSYSYRRRPEKIVVARIEAGVEPPIIIERFAHVDLVDFESGLTRLLQQLGLRRPRRTLLSFDPSSPARLPDLSDVFKDFKKTHPDPLPANLWSQKAKAIIANYDGAKPTEIGSADRKGHLDKILGELSGTDWDKEGRYAKADDLLLKATLGPRAFSIGGLRPKLSELLLAGAPDKHAPGHSSSSAPATDPPLRFSIDAPMLSGHEHDFKFRLSWTTPLFAKRFVLQKSMGEFREGLPRLTISQPLAAPVTVYEGSGGEYQLDLAGNYLGYFRVKAFGEVLGLDAESQWSNVVRWKDR